MSELFSDSSRELFNDGWQFLAPGSDVAAGAGEVPSGVMDIDLPHSWNYYGWCYEKGVNNDPLGTGWYYKKLPSGLPEGLLLRFEGISAESEIYLNGKKLCENIGAYKVFDVPLQGLKGDGEDLLALKVTDKANATLLAEGTDSVFTKSPRFKLWSMPMGSSMKAGGVWRDVWLVKPEGFYMRPPRVQSDGKKMFVMPQICDEKQGGRVRCELFYSGNQVASVEADAAAAKLVLEVADYKAWSPQNPELYELKTSLLDGEGKSLQTISQPVSFFDFCVRDSEFYLNGKPYFLRGQNGFPHCNIPHDREYIAKYVGKVKAQGVEISRFHTEPPSHAWLDECDRQGIMVIFEMALHGSMGCYPFGSEEFRKNVMDEFRSIFIEYRRHPSIAMWCLGNEMIVSCERDVGLGEPLFDILDEWIAELRTLDPRPIVSNSGGDAANMVHKSVGDVDDVHQYGGWYVENLRDLKNFGNFTQKNDMVFQPCISTESVAAYTNDNGEFFLEHSDVRQKKIVAMRMGEIKDLAREAQECQAFILKEYAEAMWRLRRKDSSFGGYIPFGQYTWFSNPFDKSEAGIKPKMIWDTYRKVMGPVHVQLECWSRNVFAGGCLEGSMHLLHENVQLPDVADFKVQFSCGGKTLLEKDFTVAYHERADCDVEIGPFSETGKQQLKIIVTCGGEVVAENDLDFKVYAKPREISSAGKISVYDPSGILCEGLKSVGLGEARKLENVDEVLALDPQGEVLLLGPHSLDKSTQIYAQEIKDWIAKGGKAVVLEQNPGPYSADVLDCGVGFIKATQPYWSRWAANLVKHADRADIVDPEHKVFDGVCEGDLRWWNVDTSLANAYLSVKTAADGDVVLSRIGNGLADDELMPVKYDYVESGYSLIMMERKVGEGSILLSSMLIGEKSALDPVAGKMLVNLIDSMSS